MNTCPDWINTERGVIYRALGKHTLLLNFWLEDSVGQKFLAKMEDEIEGGFNLNPPFIMPGPLRDWVKQTGLIGDLYSEILEVVKDDFFSTDEGIKWMNELVDANETVQSQLLLLPAAKVVEEIEELKPQMGDTVRYMASRNRLANELAQQYDMLRTVSSPTLHDVVTEAFDYLKSGVDDDMAQLSVQSFEGTASTADTQGIETQGGDVESLDTLLADLRDTDGANDHALNGGMSLEETVPLDTDSD
ncbi:hypothetical protein TWF730_002655 [Orbilia blumenaviensis]|uniref:Uncharacterized protein n=1 Tax=Orbilia blumenaviensis TaxID=1796055 RepID=A0AAV9UE22_9PEZI